MLVAQCTASAPCELPTGLPWYFGLVIAAMWIALIVGAFAIARRLLVARRARRRRDDHRALGRSPHGTDVEPW